MRQLFLEKYFPASKVSSIRKELVEFDSIIESRSTIIGNDSKSYVPIAPTIR